MKMEELLPLKVYPLPIKRYFTDMKKKKKKSICRGYATKIRVVVVVCAYITVISPFRQERTLKITNKIRTPDKREY